MIDSIDRYKTFLAAAECKSVSEAAKRLYVSQPAVSAEIATLERALRVKLFFRSNRGVTLTQEGQVLYDYVKKAFSFMEAGEEKLREISGLRSGTLRIGASDMTLRFFLLDYIADFREQYPEVRLTVSNNPTPRTLDAIRSGEIDFGVVSEPLPGNDNSDFELIAVRSIRDIFIAGAQYAPAKKKKITRQQLAEMPMMLLERHTSTRRYIDEFLGADFPEPSIELATSDLLLAFAERGIGVASIVEDFALDALRERRVVRLDLAEPIPERRFFVAYLRRLPLSAAASRMIEMLRRKRSSL